MFLGRNIKGRILSLHLINILSGIKNISDINAITNNSINYFKMAFNNTPMTFLNAPRMVLSGLREDLITNYLPYLRSDHGLLSIFM